MQEDDRPVDRADRLLGRLTLKAFAIIAFVGAVGAIIFGLIVVLAGHLIPGGLSLLLAMLLFWLGRRAWQDPSTLGQLLDRDFQPPTT
jgi:hypothetical protein